MAFLLERRFLGDVRFPDDLVDVHYETSASSSFPIVDCSIKR
jgi:hypothetical protein